MNRRRKNFAAPPADGGKKYSLPYSGLRVLIWYYRFLRGVSAKNPSNVTPLPKSYTLNPLASKICRITFLGDIMELKGRVVRFSEEVKAFVRDSEYLVGNFEGTLTDTPRVFMDQRHTGQIMDALADLFPPERTYLSMANNHAGDFGAKEFADSCRKLTDWGFTPFGTADTPYVDLGDIRIIGATMWSNRPCDYLLNFYDARAYIREKAFNILYPHWGYELYLYPNKELTEIARRAILQFDAVIGHHSHVPQPITSRAVGDIERLIAYSLGDATYGDKEKRNLYHYKYGVVMNADIGFTESGELAIADLEWSYLSSDPYAEGRFTVNLREEIAQYRLT